MRPDDEAAVERIVAGAPAQPSAAVLARVAKILRGTTPNAELEHRKAS